MNTNTHIHTNSVNVKTSFRANKEGTFYVFVSKKDERYYNKFMNKLKIEKDSVNSIDHNGLISEEKSQKIQESYEKIVEMGEKCLNLESSGKINYYSDIQEWYHLL